MRWSLLPFVLLTACGTTPAYAGELSIQAPQVLWLMIAAATVIGVYTWDGKPMCLYWPWRLLKVIGAALLLWWGGFFSQCHAEAIPPEAYRYRKDITRAAQYEFGLDAPVATLYAQLHQESRLRASAVSRAGARGMGQFMPATAEWISALYPLRLGSGEPGDPLWDIPATAAYDKWLTDRLQARTPCEKWGMTLSAYNGGLGWVYRDAKLASAKGADKLAWFNSVERFNAGRSPANFKENRDYPRKILLRWEPLYVRAGFGEGVCT